MLFSNVESAGFWQLGSSAFVTFVDVTLGGGSAKESSDILEDLGFFARIVQ